MHARVHLVCNRGALKVNKQLCNYPAHWLELAYLNNQTELRNKYLHTNRATKLSEVIEAYL